MKKISIIIICLLLLPYSNENIYKADNLENMIVKNSLFGGSGFDRLIDIIPTSDGGYVSVGWSDNTIENEEIHSISNGGSDALIVKFDKNMNPIKDNMFGGSDSDWLWDVVEVSDGYIAAGYTGSSDGDISSTINGDEDALVVKFDKDLNIIKYLTYGGDDDDYFGQIYKESDDRIFLVGQVTGGGSITNTIKGESDAIILEVDKDLNIKKEITYGGDSHDRINAITKTEDGYVAVGRSGSSASGDVKDTANPIDNDDEAIIIKFDKNMNPINDNLYGGNKIGAYYGDFVYVIETKEGNYLALGSTYDTQGGEITGVNKGWNDAELVLFDKNLNIIDQNLYGTDAAEGFNKVVQTPDGGFLAIGSSFLHNSTSVGDISDKVHKGSCLITKFDKHLNPEWDRIWGGGLDESFDDIVINDNGLVIIGYTDLRSKQGDYIEEPQGGFDSIILKIGTNNKPIINGVEDTQILEGEDFDPIKGVSASDVEDGDITKDIKVYSKDIKDLSVGNHVYNYSVEDSDGNEVVVNRNVNVISKVTSNNKPVINGVEDKEIEIGEYFDLMEGITASDVEDGDITKNIMITFNNINYNKEGKYNLTYEVTDSDLNTVTKTRNVKVIEKINIDKPSIGDKENNNKKDLIDTGKDILTFVLLMLVIILLVIKNLKRKLN